MNMAEKNAEKNIENAEKVVLVDENDIVLGTEDKIKAHELALLHRAFSVFIYRRKEGAIEILLQQRHKNKYHCGGLWTNTCCSHPRLGEDVLDAANRRLKEEMAMELPLRKIGSFCYKAVFPNGLTEHEFDHVFIGEYKTNEIKSIEFNKNEVQACRWIKVEELMEELSQFPLKYTPWLKPALAFVLEDLSCNL